MASSKYAKAATLFKGHGKLKGRYCVKAYVKKAPRSAVRGVKMKPVQFHGCFVSKAKAEARARKVSPR